MIPELNLTGQSGRTYPFKCYAPQTEWHDLAGCYAFAAHVVGGNGKSSTRILYIGQTDSFQRRMREHQEDQWTAAARIGANLVLAVTVPNEAVRLAMEQDLIRAYQPSLNTHHVQQNALAQAAPLPQPPRNRLFGL